MGLFDIFTSVKDKVAGGLGKVGTFLKNGSGHLRNLHDKVHTFVKSDNPLAEKIRGMKIGGVAVGDISEGVGRGLDIAQRAGDVALQAESLARAGSLGEARERAMALREGARGLARDPMLQAGVSRLRRRVGM